MDSGDSRIWIKFVYILPSFRTLVEVITIDGDALQMAKVGDAILSVKDSERCRSFPQKNTVARSGMDVLDDGFTRQLRIHPNLFFKESLVQASLRYFLLVFTNHCRRLAYPVSPFFQSLFATFKFILLPLNTTRDVIMHWKISTFSFPVMIFQRIYKKIVSRK